MRKEKDPDDKRATRIYLTEKKKEIEKIIREIDSELEEIMLKNFEEGEKEEMVYYLEKMLDNLEK